MNLCSAAALLLFALSAVQVTASSAGNRALGKSTLIPDAATATTTATTPATGQSMAARRPNILVIMAEDLGPRIGAFGDRLASTPNIDRLAATGVRFPNTFTAAGVCAPSRAAFITGVHQNTLGAQHMRTSTSPLGAYLAVPPPEVKAFPELLRAVGYYTFTDRKLDYQFSGIFAGTGPATIWDAEGVGAHFSGRAADQPFFGLLNLFITHESATFSSSRLEAAGDTGGAAVARAAEQARASLPVRTDPDQVSVPPYYPDTPEVRAEIATFYDNVALMDLEVGRILGDLENAGLLDSTIVLWTTDHGDALPRAKRELFDSGIRVPLVVHWPVHLRPAARAPGSVDARLVSFVDFAPTLLAFAGVAPSPFHQGGNFLSDPPRRYVFAARDRVDEQVDRVRAVRDAQHKYLRFHLPGTPGAYPIAYRDNQVIMRTLWDELAAGRLTPTQRLWFEPRPPEALYDLARDPHEVNNLAEDPAHRQTLERMRAALDDWQQRVPDLGAGDEAGMRERFWPGGVQPVTRPPELEVEPDRSQTDLGNSTTGTSTTGTTSAGINSTGAPGGSTRILSAASSTRGASLAFRLEGQPWRLYTRSMAAPAVPVEFKAVRYGYRESESVTYRPGPPGADQPTALSP